VLGDTIELTCIRCGSFRISGTASSIINGTLSDIQIANISHWIVTNDEPTISSDDLEDLKKLPTPTVGEKARRLISHIESKYPKPGEFLSINRNDPKYYSIVGCYDRTEFIYILSSYLHENRQYLETFSLTNESASFKISPEGWAYIESLKGVNPDSQIGFIAMRFDNIMDPFLEIVRQAVLDARYNPLRVDDIEHNIDINDEIIAAIRQSRFVIADFTEQRAGVYFEAGYAKGLGLEVIWLCREDHFDNEHYNFIKWNEGNLDDLKEKLTNRISATIGKGSYSPEQN
jgi:hypothetical protein